MLLLGPAGANRPRSLPGAHCLLRPCRRQLARKMEKEQQDKISEQRRSDKEAGRGGAKDLQVRVMLPDPAVSTCSAPQHLSCSRVVALQMTAQEARTELLKSKAAMGGDPSTNGNRHEIGDGLAGWQSA